MPGGGTAAAEFGIDSLEFALRNTIPFLQDDREAAVDFRDIRAARREREAEADTREAERIQFLEGEEREPRTGIAISSPGVQSALLNDLVRESERQSETAAGQRLTPFTGTVNVDRSANVNIETANFPTDFSTEGLQRIIEEAIRETE